MFQIPTVLLVLIVQRTCGLPLISPIGEEEEIVEVNENSLGEPHQHYKDVIDLSFYGAALFGEPDHEHTASLVANYTPEAYSVNPEELGVYLEGDILMPKPMVITKNGVASQTSRWPNGIVPYEIRGNFNARDMSIIELAIGEYHRRTCVRFVPRSNERDYISIVGDNSGCWSSVGRVGGRQEVNLQAPGCLTRPGTVLHELMHALGFLHEQNREERDQFVSIQYHNIQPKAIPNFDKADKTLAFGVPYDYGSVMHYSANAFSANGRPTIIPTQHMGGSQMGQREGFSVSDVNKINRMYDCGYDNVPAPAPASVSGGATPALAVDNSLVSSFVSGILTGLGLSNSPTS